MMPKAAAEMRLSASEDHEQLDADPCERDAHGSADHREQHAFREEIARDVATSGAERPTYRDLTLSGFRTYQEQIGDVGAHDQQN